MNNRSIILIAVAAALAVPSLATAQRQHAAALGDLMTAFVQPRHIKIGLAGAERNWPCAAYELDQLRETLADVAEILPNYRDLSIPDMITTTVKEPLAELDRAIKAEDSNQFATAYGRLTAGCDACHRSYDRGGDRDPAGDGRRFSGPGFPPDDEMNGAAVIPSDDRATRPCLAGIGRNGASWSGCAGSIPGGPPSAMIVLYP